MSELGYERKSSAVLERRLGALLEGDDPVVVGPWMAELGHELLLWVPFLRWAVERFEVDPARLTVVSRGGVGSWYAGIAGSYADIFDAVAVDEFRSMNESRWAALGGMKQSRFTSWDRALLERTVDWDGHSPVLHPAYMFRFLRRFWKGGLSLSHVLGHLRLRRLDPPPLDPWLEALLPDEYVVATFYYRPSFANWPEHQAFVQGVIDALAEETTVVLLETGIKADDHEEARVELSDRVLMPLDGAPPAQNLGLQTAVTARARTAIGTHGGRSHIAPAFGVPCLAFAADRGEFLPSYLDVLRRLTRVTGAPYSVFEPADLHLLTTMTSAVDLAAA